MREPSISELYTVGPCPCLACNATGKLRRFWLFKVDCGWCEGTGVGRELVPTPLCLEIRAARFVASSAIGLLQPGFGR